MAKRKREDRDDAGDDTSVAASTHDYRQQRRLVHTFEDAAKQLARAFKTAKGFERQKLGRRKKQSTAGTADSSERAKDAERIDAETLALKALDPSAAAQQYLAKCLLRTKAVSGSTSLPDVVRTAWTATAAGESRADSAMLNITARLCNSNPVKEALPAAFDAVVLELGVDLIAPVVGAQGAGQTSKQKRLRKKDYEPAPEGTAAAAAAAVATAAGHKSIERRPTAWDAGTEILEKGSDKHRNGGGVADSQDEADETHQARLASSDNDESDDEEASDVKALERQLAMEGIGRRAQARPNASYSLAADLSLSDSDGDDRDNHGTDVDDADDAEPSSAPPEPHKTAALQRSAFLPSLTMGGYLSGSGSDVEMDDLDAAAPRKNRRGQRARQQIWEKKFGARAKHLQRAADGRKKGWDPKRGAVSGSGRDRRAPAAAASPHGSRAGVSQQERATGANASTVRKPRRDDTGSLHPSWEAARQAKLKTSTPVAFEGKKISFD